MEKIISYQDFKNSSDHLFLLKDHNLQLRLIEVSPQKLSGPWESFSLLFKAEGDFSLSQGTFLLKSDALGEFELFLVPIGENSSVTLYESVFNRQSENVE